MASPTSLHFTEHARKLPRVPLMPGTKFWSKALLSLAFWLIAGAHATEAQNQLEPFARQQPAMRSAATAAFDPILEPFYHGVASGDPQPDGIILWTRVTPETDVPVVVSWELSLDTAFSSLVQSGSVTTDSSADYTVKLPLSGLNDGTTYYYRFRALGRFSIIGRTRTADQNADQLRFAVVSCNNYPAGYFNAFGRLAERNDLDAIVHLGDFIYEYAEGEYGDGGDEGRQMLEPENEILTRSDYRQRYAWYRLDPDLRRAMQQHPFIFVWDDHESANDSWTGGAENHDPLLEGDWAIRRREAAKAYFEWIPIRDDADFSIYRTFSYGDLAEWRMLDTRLEGRQEQLTDHTDPALWNAGRTLLGEEQFNWFTSGLKSSAAQWKLVGNQVVFAPLILENFESIYPGVRDQFLDVWMGYPAERNKILDTLQQHNIDNVVFLTGDVHIAVALDVPFWDGDSLYYNPETGEGSQAVEFVGTSITSDNFDEIVGVFLANLVEELFLGENPQGVYNEFDQHGYFVLDLTPTRAQADYYYVASILEPNSSETFDEGWYSLSGENRLQKATAPAPPKPIQEVPAPDPTFAVGLTPPPAALQIWKAWPNPAAAGRINVAFTLNRQSPVQVRWINTGTGVATDLYQAELASGHYTLQLNLPAAAAGSAGVLELKAQEETRSLKVMR
ncbi:MAG: phosphodiesterase [Bacteroidetes bacterium]|nr:phosphodiesterase [Bacteroidota bacterium]